MTSLLYVARIFVAIFSLLVIFACIAFLLRYFFREFRQIVSGYWVPFVPTPDYKVEVLLENLDLKDGQTFVDIGCWDGKILQAVCARFPNVRVLWYEKSARPFKMACERKFRYGLGYEVFQKDFFRVSFENADVIYVYMIPYLMSGIWRKAKQECKKWTILISSAFDISGVSPHRTIRVTEGKTFYVYKVD